MGCIVTCPDCGDDYGVGMFPFCRGKGSHGTGYANVIGDECSITQENGFRHPVHFTSKIERKRALKEAGLHEVVKNAGPDDKHCPRWVTMDAYTLKNATELVSRASTFTGNDPGEAPVKMRITHVSGDGIG